MDIKKLSAAEKKALLAELEQDKKAQEEALKKEREAYKRMVDSEVKACFPALKKISAQMAVSKKNVFDNFKTLIKLKAELYDREEDQYSHTFTTTDGAISITIGRNINDGWDDTVNTGIGKVHDFLENMATDDKSKKLVAAIMRLLAKDQKGNLKASRVLQLKKLADDVGDKKLIEAIQIIQDAYRPTPSKEYIRCEFKAANGEKVPLPLSITDAPLDNPNNDK